jgi:hypothetical protein
MARPRIFVSSTYYDLKHVRATLELFIESLGYEAVLSEKGSIAYNPEQALDESCYREVLNTDIFVLIVGGRYGAEKSDSKGPVPKGFYERYDSITKGEYEHAVENNIPIYILVEKSVYADYETYLQNKTNKTVNYPHVDSANIFLFLEQILGQTRNNALQQFDRYAEIEAWLREQWAGLFRDMLARQSSQHQIASLSSQVGELAEVNKTLKIYLEEVVSKLNPSEAAGLIATESKRLEEAREMAAIVENGLGKHLISTYGIPAERIGKALRTAGSPDKFAADILSLLPEDEMKERLSSLFKDHMNAVTRDLNLLRVALNLPPWLVTPRKIGKSIRADRPTVESDD